jgi:GNAT superfamily N-acetyltransferase
MDVDTLLRRPYDPTDTADAIALAQLMNVVDRHGGGHPGHSPDELNGLVNALVADPETDSTMLFEPGGRLVAAGFTTTPPDGGDQLYLTGGVHPDWRGRGIGRDLVGRHLDRARQLHRARARGATWRLMAHNQLGDHDAARLLRRFGFQAARYWFDMTARTDLAPPVAPPPGIRLVPYTPEYEDGVYLAHTESFADTWGFQRRDRPAWRDLTVQAKRFLPHLSFVTLAPDPVGFVFTYDHPDDGRVYIGQIGVRAPWRRQGLATALLTRVLNAAAHTAHHHVELHVDAASPTGAVTIYERAGFKTQSQVVTHLLELTAAA